jgi:hypothetical protein
MIKRSKNQAPFLGHQNQSSKKSQVLASVPHLVVSYAPLDLQLSSSDTLRLSSTGRDSGWAQNGLSSQTKYVSVFFYLQAFAC